MKVQAMLWNGIGRSSFNILAVCASASFLLMACSNVDGLKGLASSNFDKQMELASTLVEENRLNEARVLYSQIALQSQRQPQKVAALKELGDVYLRLDDSNSAAASFREILSVSPSNSDGLVGLGIALNLSGDPAGAEAPLRQAAATKDIRAFSPLGVTLDMLGRHTEAQEIYLAGISQDPDRRELVSNLALSYALNDDYQSALSTISQVSTLLFVPDRFKRNHVLILAMSGYEGDTRTLGEALNLDETSINNAVSVGLQLRGQTGPARITTLKSLIM